ncbi:3,4-dihydroxy-2-butanone-4-phosphate synthase [Streptomyces zingiberis]|uniref:Multifunctional fusion protein n=1 Tax=Streptomyces zingiberis TaxID=2053010 RepID=A0ABX1BZK0_9ACTN|nr:3,4-dihydroxy-2-butanone-4-phosphate synthase [Streptomyces zingiberis]NJQ03104.1 3,4-dihydroxy-2-butanone-4-phosphate synthase [Streptomyces zingiberis]
MTAPLQQLAHRPHGGGHGADGYRDAPGDGTGSVLDPVALAVAEIAAGRPVVVVDDEDRENEGDLVVAAEHATPGIVAFMMTECRGLICAPLEGADLDRLDLPQMVGTNTESMSTAFTVSVDASAAHGVTTGISAADRSATLRLLADGGSAPGDFVRPGHVFPLRARPGGVLARPGHTEAGVDLARLAGLRPAAAIVEIAAEDGTMLRLPELVPFARKHGLAIISIEDLIAYRRAAGPAGVADPAGTPAPAATAGHTGPTEPAGAPGPAPAARASAVPAAVPPAVLPVVRREAETWLPTPAGEFRALGYRATADGVEHIALVRGEIGDGRDVLVRVHSECLTGDVFGSLRCDCGPQLQASLDRVAEEGRGVVLYLRGHEGRGIGLLSKLRAYELQEQGRDTLDANLELGLPADARDYAAAAWILADLGVESPRLMTNNPEKTAALAAHGLEVTRVPAPVAAGEHNLRYLRTKRDRMGHDLPWLEGRRATAAHRR